ncbi:MAG: class I SAM-dependent methyltransferase [Pseudomonadales bacterium]|nr:class I SAM-dependent methyltransferase [Pseudomonadales bacterium]
MSDHMRLGRWDERYESEEYFFGTAPNDFLKEVAGRVPKGRTLCLADGEGRNGVYLATQGFDVVSIDASVKGLEKATRLAAAQGTSIETRVADLFEYDFGEGCWDCIVSIFFHMPPENRKDVHARIVRGLAPGGHLIFESYRPEQVNYGTGGPPIPEFMMTMDDVRGDFGALTFLHAEAREREVVEGRGHSGLAAVVQLLAAKPAA